MRQIIEKLFFFVMKTSKEKEKKKKNKQKFWDDIQIEKLEVHQKVDQTHLGTISGANYTRGLEFYSINQSSVEFCAWSQIIITCANVTITSSLHWEVSISKIYEKLFHWSSIGETKIWDEF